VVDGRAIRAGFSVLKLKKNNIKGKVSTEQAGPFCKRTRDVVN